MAGSSNSRAIKGDCRMGDELGIKILKGIENKMRMYMITIFNKPFTAFGSHLRTALAVVVAVVTIFGLIGISESAPITVINQFSTTPCGIGTTGSTTSSITCTNPTIGAGSNRVLVLIVTGEGSGNHNPAGASATYGTAGFTEVQNSYGNNNNRRFTWMGYIDESQISANAGSDISITVTSNVTWVGTEARYAVYGGVDQTTPLSGSTKADSPNTTTTVSMGPITTVADGVAIYAVSANATTGNTTVPTNYTEHVDQVDNSNNYYVTIGSRTSLPSTSESVSMTAVNARWTAAFMALAPVSCVDSDLATLTTTAPTSGSTVSGVYTIQTQVGTETAPSGMTGMVVNIANAGACNVTNGVMTWNAGTSRWEYSWDTSACGTGAPVTGVTIDVSGTDPDCSTAVNAPQITNITIDNTCTDSDLAILTTTAPTSGSTVSGTYMVQVQVGNETAPSTMTNMAVTIAGSSACNVTGAAMTWNAGTSRWEYSWDTSACGTGAPETGITIDASGNDPDCGDLVNATQITGITIDNTGPSYTITQCTDCHQMPPTDATTGRGTPAGAVVGSHSVAEHLATTCTNCHIDNGTNLAHREGLIEMITNIHGQTGAFYDKDGDGTQTPADLSFSQTSTPTPGSCRSTFCHGTSSPTWGTDLSGTSQCYRCHGDVANPNNAPPVDTAGDTLATDAQVGAHQTHLQSLNNYSSDIQCSECHTVPTTVGDPGHIDNALPADLTWGTLAKTNGATPSYTAGTCSNVYCHDESYFKNAWGTGTDPAWNDTSYLVGTSTDCTKCHGYPPGGGHPVDNNCTSCHSHVNATNDGFSDATLHVNGNVEGGGDCIGCHSSQQGTARRNVSPDFTKTSHHVSTGMPTNVLTCAACHGDLIADRGHPGSATADPQTELQNADTGVYATIDPSVSSATLTTYCLSCHDADGASRLGANAMQPFIDSGDSTAPPNVNLAWTNTYNHSANAECNDCHGDDSAAGTTLDPNYNMHGSARATLLRGATEYDTCVTNGCHGAGGSALTDMTVELSGTGGKHPIGSAVTPLSPTLQNDTAGNMFVNGWSINSVAQCSDCHGMNQGGSNNVGPRGPHGSAYNYIIRGADTSINTVTSGRQYGTPKNSGATTAGTRENFCINCHASDVYSLGDSNQTVPSNESYSWASHYNDGLTRNVRIRPRCGGNSVDGGQNKGASYIHVGCLNCHAGGRHNYGAHSSTWAVGWSGGTGLMNGAAWSQPYDSNNCYANQDPAWSNCNQGNHN